MEAFRLNALCGIIDYRHIATRDVFQYSTLGKRLEHQSDLVGRDSHCMSQYALFDIHEVGKESAI